jgi:transcriptional regulator with XRE-family HTH domain
LHLSFNSFLVSEDIDLKFDDKRGMDQSTSPYTDFAKNLRVMAEKKGPIALVCRELGMNRQQFNKYLSGTSLPAQATLEKIATYFGVDQRAMFNHFESQLGKIGLEDVKPLLMLGQIDTSIADRIVQTLSGSVQTQLKEGCYIIYYPWLPAPTDIVRAVMVVFKVGKITCFRRYTRFAMKGQSSAQSARGQHEGIVIEQNGRTFLLGKNIQGFGELSLQSFGASTVADFSIMSGLALVITPWAEPLATRVTIDYFGSKESFRRALKFCGVVSGATSDISETIRRSILEPVSFPTAQLAAFQMFDFTRP